MASHTVTSVSTRKLIELLQAASADGAAHVRILNETQLGVGPDPFRPATVIDFSSEKLMNHDQTETVAVSFDNVVPLTVENRTDRRLGNYWFEINGERYDAGSLKSLLREALRQINYHDAQALPKLSRIKPRSRRIVAREPKDLFDQPHLVEEYAERLDSHWFYGTNNSAQETEAWLKRACECANLEWGKDFKTNIFDLARLA